MGELQLDFDDRVLHELINLIYRHTGISMSEKKDNMIRARLRPRLRELQLSSYEEYISLLEGSKEEVMVFIDLITTNETSFFRTPRIWDFFTNEYLREWNSAHSSSTLNIWSAASSTGEEAYSIAMTCLENSVKDFKIFSSDISREVVQLATAGTYNSKSSLDFERRHPQLLEKYFQKSASGLTAKKVLKDHVTFDLHNLFMPLKSKVLFDVVFLRNVLIYFNNEDQTKVLMNISQSLRPGGVLILGESESIARLHTCFKYKAPLIYVRE